MAVARAASGPPAKVAAAGLVGSVKYRLYQSPWRARHGLGRDGAFGGQDSFQFAENIQAGKRLANQQNPHDEQDNDITLDISRVVLR